MLETSRTACGQAAARGAQRDDRMHYVLDANASALNVEVDLAMSLDVVGTLDGAELDAHIDLLVATDARHLLIFDGGDAPGWLRRARAKAAVAGWKEVAGDAGGALAVFSRC